MANDNWYGKSFETIQKQLSALANNNAQALLTDWYSVSQIVHQSLEDAKKAHDKLNDTNFWDGAGPRAAQASMRTNILDQITDDGLQNKTYKMSEALANDGGTLNASSGVPGRHKLPKDATDSEREEATYQLAQDAQRTYSTPMDVTRPKIDDAASDNSGSGAIQQPGGGGGSGGGGGGNSGGGGSDSKPQSPGGGTDGLADKNTKPQLANGDGQGGQGQGAGSGSGSGAGGGQGAGSGSGAGGSSPFGSGSGTGTGGSGLPLGSTTAAGYGPSGSAGGTGLASGTAGGASALRAGGGLPGGATSGAGANPAAIGAAGVRGGAMGPMGMMGGAGAHGKGGHGEDDDEHETPAILINLDNTYEFMGDLPKASPAVIGDWSEQEKADKQAQEREKRRYKKLGWDVEFE